MRKASPDDYVSDLREALELRDLPRTAVTDIVREVESHIAESGEDPVFSFGSARDYADSFAPRPRSAALVALAIASWALAFVGAYIVITGVFALQSTSRTVFGFAPAALIAIGAALIIGWAFLIVVVGVRSRARSRSWRIHS